MLMTSRMPTTLCWMYDIMYVMGIKYDPREITQQERKVRRSIEDVIVQLTTETAMIASTEGSIAPEEKFFLTSALNPSIYDMIEKTEMNEEERKLFPSEAEMLNLKIKRMLPQFDRVVGRDSAFKGVKVIQGPICQFYLRGFCFITMKAMLYELTEKMLSVTNKDKMADVVRLIFDKSNI